MPDEIRAMPYRYACGFFRYWKLSPPENELLAFLTEAFTSWSPERDLTESEVIAEHRRSLERRWKAGAMNPKQMFEAMGGKIGASASDHPYAGIQSTGIGQWPPKF